MKPDDEPEPMFIFVGEFQTIESFFENVFGRTATDEENAAAQVKELERIYRL